MTYYPMKISYVPKNIIWGGKKLETLYGKKSGFEKIAESWELTVRDDGMSYIENGCYIGKSLREFIKEFPSAVSPDFDGDCFPLLIKFIDAEKDLSVQVHPDDVYASVHENTLGKTEMWYVVDADENAHLIYGLADNISKENFCTAVTGEMSYKIFNELSIKAGDVFFIPPGQVHAICEGTLIAEIQQNSNVTYRIYDYGRLDSDGKPRELHKDKAIDVVKHYSSNDIRKLSFSGNPKRRAPLTVGDILCDCKQFRVTHLKKNKEVDFTVDEQSFASLLFTHAENTVVSCCDHTLTVSSGDSVFIPSGAGKVILSGDYNVLISEI